MAMEDLPECEEDEGSTASDPFISFFSAAVFAMVAVASYLLGVPQLFLASRHHQPLVFWTCSLSALAAIFLCWGSGSVAPPPRPPRPALGGGYNLLVFAVAALSIMYLAASALNFPVANGAFVSPSAYLNSGESTCPPDDFEYCSDSGANRFVTNDVNDFVPGSVFKEKTIVAVGGGNVTSTCTGTIQIRSIDHGHVIECHDVLLLPTCAKKLLPAFQFVSKGCKLTYKDNTVTLVDQQDHAVLSGKEFGGLFYFHCETVRDWTDRSLPPDVQSAALFGLPVCKNISAKSVDFSRKLLEAHWCYGHMHFDKLRKMFKLGKGNDPDCAVCTITKQKQLALSDHPHTRSTRQNHRMHMDVGYTAGKNYMFQLYVDDFHRVSYLDMLDSKVEVLPKWIELKNHLENDSQPWRFAFLKSDSEVIYFTPAWQEHCTENGITHESSNPYLHGQNGVVERAMQTVGIAFRCFMLTGNAPERCVPAALRFANVIRCHSPTKANNGMTPLEKQAGKKLPVNQRLLQGPLFCLVFAHVYEVQRVKHAPRGVACVYLGYQPDDNTYLVMDWKSGEEYYTSSVDFHPNIFPFRANPERVIGSINRWDDLAPHTTDIIEPGDALEQRHSIRQRGYRFDGNKALALIPDEDVPPEVASNLSAEAWQLGYAGDVPQHQMFFIHGPDPDGMEEALRLPDCDDWIMAELSEKESFKYHKVFDVVPRSFATSRGKRIFKDRPVLKYKYNPDGSIDKRKFRLTVAAFTKMLKEGVDYSDKHANTVRWNAIKMLIAIVVYMDFDMILFDIATFFLFGELEDEIYMEIP